MKEFFPPHSAVDGCEPAAPLNSSPNISGPTATGVPGGTGVVLVVVAAVVAGVGVVVVVGVVSAVGVVVVVVAVVVAPVVVERVVVELGTVVVAPVRQRDE